ncbi:MAG: GNAT family N-acetyltransferase [Magnetococcus sp. THC-1_WYH]
MNYFLGEEWLSLMEKVGTVSRARCLEIAGNKIWVGEYQNAGQKKWQLYGFWEDDGLARLEELFDLGRQQGIFQVESVFNMARWTDRAMLEEVGAEIVEEFGTYMVDLGRSQEQLWSGLYGTHRNRINRAVRGGLEIRFEVTVESFVALMDETYAKGGLVNPFSHSYLTHLFQLPGQRLLVVGVFSSRGIEAGAVVPWDRSRGYFLHSATRQDSLPGAANLLHWEVMLELKRRGVAGYDFGGARRDTNDPRLAGIFHFKERFGGTFIPCWYWRKVISPGRKWWHDAVVGMRGWGGGTV